MDGIKRLLCLAGLALGVKAGLESKWRPGHRSGGRGARFRTMRASSAADADVDVLIVGAGPTGLVLALWLTRLGVQPIAVVR